MKLADVVIRLSKEGHDVPRSDVTPAELLLLVAEHHANAGGDPIVSITETGDTTMKEGDETVETRTVSEEVGRLKMRYGSHKVEHLFQGAIPNLPATFDEAKEIGIHTVLPSSRLTIGR